MNGLVETAPYPHLESLIASFGMSYVLEDEFPIEALKIDEHTQARETTHRAPANRVQEYMIQMRNGANFPPILVCEGTHYLIDGNTRLAAARKLRRTTIAAYIVDTKTELMARLLGAAINQLGGERLTAEEAFTHASIMLDEGMEPDSITRYLGYPASTVRKWQTQKQVSRRAEALQLSAVADRVSRSTLGKLASVSLDRPFAELLKLTADARLGEREVKEVVDAVQNAPSEAAALGVIRELREERAPCGPPPAVPTKNLKPVRAACGLIAKGAGNPSSMFDPHKAAEELTRWQAVLDVATEVTTTIKASA